MAKKKKVVKKKVEIKSDYKGVDILKLDYVPPELEQVAKNKSGFKKHPVYDFIPDGDEGKKLLKDYEKDKKAKDSKKVSHIGDTAIDEENVCDQCGIGFMDKDALEYHIEKVHAPDKELDKLDEGELTDIAEKKGKTVLKNDTKKDIIGKISDNA